MTGDTIPPPVLEALAKSIEAIRCVIFVADKDNFPADIGGLVPRLDRSVYRTGKWDWTVGAHGRYGVNVDPSYACGRSSHRLEAGTSGLFQCVDYAPIQPPLNR